VGLRSILIDSVEVWRPTVTQATSGAAQATYIKIASDVKVRLVDRSTNEKLVQGKEDNVSTHLLMCGPGEDIQADDDCRMRVGQTQYVFRVNTIDDSWRVKSLHHQQAMVTLISKTGFSREPKIL